MSDDALRPGGALEGPLFRRFLKQLSEVREPEVGERIGAWRILRELGRGGSGVVFLAERADGAYTQQVAFKWLRGDRPVPGGRGVLARERQLLASLDHPNIARLVDGGETEQGMLWFAMDLAAGRTITEQARELPLRARVTLLHTLCSAVDHAHRRGLIHGDIKPSNVLVDDRGQPRLVDFGIARLKGAALGPSYGLTPDYASPEQRAGDELTTASDIWQLGRLLEEMKQSTRVGSELEAIIRRATAEVPEERYASAAALAADLGHWLAGRPVAARGGGAAYRLACLVRRNRALSAVVISAVAVIVAGGAWATWQLALERDAARASAAQAQAALEDTEAALARARALHDFLIGLFRASEAGLPRDQLPDTGALLERGARRALDGESVPDAERFGMLLTLAEVYMTLGRNDQARPLLETAVQLARRHAQRRPEDLAHALARQGYMAMAEGQAERAEAVLLEAEAAAEGQRGAEDAWAHARTRRAWLTWRMGRVEQALALLAPVEERLRSDQADRLQPATRLQAFNALASIHSALGDHQRAFEFRSRAVAMAQRLHGADSRGHAIQLANLAGDEIRLGRFESAEQNLRRAIELYDRIFDRPVVLRAAAYGNLANLLAYTGRPDDALEIIDASTAEWAEAEGEPVAEHVWRDYHFGRLLLRMERPDEARPRLERALDRFDALDQPPLHGPIMTRAWLARIECREGALASGQALLAEIDRLGALDNAAHRADLLEARASCLVAAGDPAGAIEALERSLELVDWPGYALHRSQRWRLLGEAFELAGQRERAGRAFDRGRVLRARAGMADSSSETE